MKSKLRPSKGRQKRGKMISKRRLLEYIKVTSSDLGDAEHEIFELRREVDKLKYEMALLHEKKCLDNVKRKVGRPRKES